MIRALKWIHRNTPPIALDLGHRVVRMLQHDASVGRPATIRYAQRELPVGLDEAERDRLQSEAVRDMLAREHFVGREVITALSWDDLIIRNLRLPDGLTESTIVERAAEQLGFDLSTIQMRYLTAGDVRQGTSIGREIIVLAAEKQAIDRHVNLLTSLGLTPVALDAPPCATFRAFQQLLRREGDQEHTNAFVDMGYTSTRVIVHRGRDVLHIKTVPIGGARLDELLSQQMDLSLSDAAWMRIRMHRHPATSATGGGFLPEQIDPVSADVSRAMLAAMRPALEHIGQEIGQCIRYCASTFRGHRVRAVSVVGGEAGNNDMLQLLSDVINMPCQASRLMRYSVANTQASNRRSGRPEWATVMGLALKPIRVPLESS